MGHEVEWGRMRVPRWTLLCADCTKDFVHSEIAHAGEGFIAWSAFKPEFPIGGQLIKCPHCTKSSVYQRYELVLQTT
jgi:hypothetical protein